MIKFVQRNDLDDEKYNRCVKESHQALLYAYSWYLDCIVDNWGVLVLNDYEAVMPIPLRKKYTIEYVYPPLWILQLGIFSKNENALELEFLTELKKRFKFIELRLNTGNTSKDLSNVYSMSQFQTLDLQLSYEEIFDLYKSDRKKDLKKATKYDLVECWGDTPEKLIKLFKENVGARVSNIKEKDYQNLRALIEVCVEKRVGEILSIYGAKDELVASAFFIKNREEVTILCSSTDFSNRKNGANTFLIDRAIYKYQTQFKTFNFGGSSIDSIATYFLSFKGVTKKYPFVRENNLPWFLKVFKS